MKSCITLLLMVLFSVTTIAQSTASANVHTFKIKAPKLKGERKIWVYHPHYFNSGDKKYPVVYMHDGQNLFDAATAYSGEWHIDEILDSLKAQVIIIGIENGGEKRIDELTPFTNEKYGGGHASEYLDFIIDTLKPYIDKTYRTKSNAENTFIAGSSLGGLVSYYALLKHPDIFGGAIVFSPSFWINKDMLDFTESTQQIKGKLYFMAGDAESEDMVPDLQKIEKILREKIKRKKQMHTKIVTGGKHNEQLWSGQFVNAYHWLIR